MRLSCILAGLIVALIPSGPSADEKLLLGFEDAEVRQWADVLKGKRTEAKTKDDLPHVLFTTAPDGNPAAQQWRFFKGKASQGEYAMGLGLIGSGERYSFKVPAEPQRLYGIFRNNSLTVSALNTCGTFRRLMPMDWSAYDRLRLDVFCEDVDQTICVQLEDEEIAPPIERKMAVKAGSWTTLEVDLRELEKSRRLDLKRMATLLVAVVQAEGKLKKNPCAWLDNVRLSGAAAPAVLPVVRDARPLDLPDYYKTSSKPAPERLPEGRPDRAPLGQEKPILIPMDKDFAVTPVGWAAAYDNQHLLVGFCDGSKVFALQSADGGRTWTGLEDKTKPTLVPSQGYLDHQAGRGDVVGQRGDVLLFANRGCYGTVLSPPRYFSQKVTFTGSGWTVDPDPTLVDCDLRHCSSNQSVVRTADGRLWACYGIVGRLGTNQINVRYSDDDGVTWKASREGTSGVIPGSIESDKAGSGFGYRFDEPTLVPFGSGVACIWEEYGPNPDRNRLLWARFDGAKWSAIEEIPGAPRHRYVWSRPRLHAVSVGAKEIFMSSGFRKGLLHWSDGKWTQEPIDVPFGARLSVAGDKTVVVVAIRSVAGGDLQKAENGALRKGPMALVAWQRRADGKWSEPQELSREEHPLSDMAALNELRPGLVVQAYAPPNFVPVAWSCQGQRWIKFLRLPVDR